MRKDYNVGMPNNSISFSAKVGTPGIATTVVYQFKPDGTKLKLAESNAESGNIYDKSIGQAKDLIKTYLKMRTIVNFGKIDPSMWEQLKNSIVVECQLKGGFSGSQLFPHDSEDKTASENGKVVVVDIEINMNGD
jgi:hypothetical protein